MRKAIGHIVSKKPVENVSVRKSEGPSPTALQEPHHGKRRRTVTPEGIDKRLQRLRSHLPASNGSQKDIDLLLFSRREPQIFINVQDIDHVLHPDFPVPTCSAMLLADTHHAISEKGTAGHTGHKDRSTPPLAVTSKFTWRQGEGTVRVRKR